MDVNNISLLKTKALIDGAWVGADSGKTFPVINPANSQVLEQLPDMSASETYRAIDAAAKAFNEWKNVTAEKRAALLRAWGDAIEQHKEELAALLTLEQGKPLCEAQGEVVYGLDNLRNAIAVCERLGGEVIPTNDPSLRFMAIKQPIGVTAVITAWNFPIALFLRKVAACLAAGCTAVIKPSEETPLTSLALAELAIQAGIPRGVINIVTAQNPQEVGAALMASKIVKKLTFTGSTGVGKLLMRDGADTIKKLTLELGGNGPCLIFDDADLDHAVQNVVKVKLSNAGQICTNINRVLVHESIHDAFVQKVAVAMNQVIVGDGFDPQTLVGPMINQKAVQKLVGLIDDAKKRGATIVQGGKPHELGHNFFEPTLIVNATPAMRIAREEIFGPIIAIYRFTTEDEALAFANDTDYGLAGYLFTKDYTRITRVSEELECGLVGVNTTSYRNAMMPFGGIKASGMGREGGSEGVEAFMETKSICIKL